MTIAADIVQSGFREGNLIPAGKQPTQAELDEALPLLNRFINGIFGYEMGENLRDWQVPPVQRTAPAPTTFPQAALSRLGVDIGTESITWQLPPKNTRIIFGAPPNGAKVWFPSNPQDGSRMAVIQGSGAGDDYTDGSQLILDGNGRFIDGAATVTLVAPIAAGKAWIYRADVGQWLTCADVASGDEMPFPKDLDDFFICGLAMRLAPRYGKITAAETAKTAVDSLKRLKARYRQAGTTTYGGENLNETSQSYLTGRSWW